MERSERCDELWERRRREWSMECLNGENEGMENGGRV